MGKSHLVNFIYSWCHIIAFFGVINRVVFWWEGTNFLEECATIIIVTAYYTDLINPLTYKEIDLPVHATLDPFP
jgi:hypothetical protein